MNITGKPSDLHASDKSNAVHANGNFLLPLPLITSLFLSDPSVTDILISSLQFVPKKKNNPSFSVTQQIVAPDTLAVLKSVLFQRF